MKKYKYILCHKNMVNELILFIKKFWNKNHILTKDKILFDWQYKNNFTKKYNFILCILPNNKIVGILGFIPINQFSQKINFKNAAWLSMWINNNKIKSSGIGIGMINYLQNKIGIKDILNIGLNDNVLPLFKYLKYKTGILNHNLIINNQIKKFVILGNYKSQKKKHKSYSINKNYQR